MKPFTVFKGGEREQSALNEEFENQFVVVSSPNVWSNAELILTYLRRVPGIKETF